MIGLALLRDGIQPGAVGIEHGYGHTELGARAHVVDGKAMPHNPALAAGVNLNDLGFGDPTRGAHASVWIDWVWARRCGRACRPDRARLGGSVGSSVR